ncbi:hypothetical protein ABZT27_34375 [Streptomyces sp. NPDC005389]|uniref:hypothetical protein n=1 Tax=Streptomyces sp. NPDC005389 TaxID=3157040 RepID=UPI0033A5A17F
MDTTPNHTGPTVAEFRNHIAAELENVNALQRGILQALVETLDSYTDEWAQTEQVTRGPLSGSDDPRWAEHVTSIAMNFPDEQRPAVAALLQIRREREAGEAAVQETPAMIRSASAAGVPVADIAALLSITTRYVYSVLREERRALARELIRTGANADQLAGNDPRAALERYEAALAEVPEEHRKTAETLVADLRAAAEEQESKNRPTE